MSFLLSLFSKTRAKIAGPRTVGSVLSSLSKVQQELAEIRDQRAAEANTLRARAVAAEAEANHAHRVSTNLNILLS